MEREDLRIVLGADHAARGEGTAVAEPLDLQGEGGQGVAAAHEVGVEGVGQTGLIDRSGRREQGLGDHLAPVDAAHLGERTAGEGVVPAFVKREDSQD